MIKEIESHIVEILKAGLPEVVCDQFPDDPHNWQYWSDNGMVLVQYKESRYDIADVSMGAYKRAMTFHIVIIHRDLREHDGAYNVLERVKKSLHSQVIEGASGKVQLVSERGEKFEHDNGAWWWELVIKVPTVFVAECPEGEKLRALNFE